MNVTEPTFMSSARAHTNIALIKYWGKRDENYFLPMNSSLSLTLDAFYTDTRVTFHSNADRDRFFLNGVEQRPQETEKITRFLNLFRHRSFGNPIASLAATVESYNFVPTAAGLASSASAFAALATATNAAIGAPLKQQQLSTFARQGSGSATRSIYGGFVEWQMGTSTDDSCAIPIDDATWDIGMIIIVVNARKKPISSREGMALTVKTSPFYKNWVQTAAQDLVALKQAIRERHFKRLGEITESNGMKMHATMLGATPPFCYFEPESIVAQQQVRMLREKGFDAYMTMDAGPNVKILCRASAMADIKRELLHTFTDDQIITTLPGPAAFTLTADQWATSEHLFHKR